MHKSLLKLPRLTGHDVALIKHHRDSINIYLMQLWHEVEKKALSLSSNSSIHSVKCQNEED